MRSLTMGTPKKREHTVAELRRARQEAFDALLKARLEGQSEAVVADATEQAQRLLDALLTARLEFGETE
ncbi:MAG: hypothetical protein M3072_02415 [Candidatus Dormibacteraeota bacterium]|nr:hypothetical protein [Candidatus Dormibacteraeota bacterium]